MFPIGEIALLGACMMVLTVLMRAAAPLPVAAQLARGAPVAGGLFLGGLGLGRLLGVPGFLPAQGWPELAMAGIGLAAWAFGLMRLFRRA